MFKQHTTGSQLLLALILAVGSAVAPGHAAANEVAAQSLELPAAMPEAAVVTLLGQDLFAVTAALGTLTSAQRATAIKQRLLSLADGSPAALATLRLGEEHGYMGIYADDALIRAVTDQDAAHSGRTRRQLATEHAVGRVFSGLFEYLPSLVAVIVIVALARYVLKALKAVFEQLSAGRIRITGFYSDWGQPTYSMVRFFVITITGIMVFPYLPGTGSDGFKGISVFIGLLVSLGAASSVSNIMAGVIITFMRPFQLGDRVKIADAIGDVTGKNLLVVRLKTIKNVEITLPDALVLANHIINFSTNAAAEGLILHTSVTIGYDVSWRRVHELLIKAASQVEAIEAEPAPFALQTSLAASYVTYQLNAYTRLPREMANIYSRLHEEIQNTFFAGGVQILSPHYASVRDGNRAALPEEYLPKDYKAPTFDILSRILRPHHGA